MYSLLSTCAENKLTRLFVEASPVNFASVAAALSPFQFGVPALAHVDYSQDISRVDESDVPYFPKGNLVCSFDVYRACVSLLSQETLQDLCSILQA